MTSPQAVVMDEVAVEKRLAKPFSSPGGKDAWANKPRAATTGSATSRAHQRLPRWRVNMGRSAARRGSKTIAGNIMCSLE